MTTPKRLKAGRPPRADHAKITRDLRLKAAAGGGSVFVETAPGEGRGEARRFRSSKYVKALRHGGIRAAVYNVEGGDGYIVEVSAREAGEGEL